MEYRYKITTETIQVPMPVTLTEKNIIDKMFLVKNLIPLEINENFVFLVSKKTHFLYLKYLTIPTCYTDYNFSEGDENLFQGYKIIGIDDIPNDTIIVTVDFNNLLAIYTTSI